MENPKHGMDSSTEELTPEQKLLLKSTKRQEPQGEEHIQRSHPLIKENAKREESPPSSSTTSSASSVYEEDEDPSSRPRRVSAKNSQCSIGYGSGPRKNRNMSLDSNSHSAYNTLIIHQNTSSLLADTWIPASHEFTSVGMGNSRDGSQRPPNSSTSVSSRKSPSPGEGSSSHTHQSQNSDQSYRKGHPNNYENLKFSDSGNTTSSELSDIPRDYLNQLTVLKHLAKEVQQDPISGTSPGDLLRSASFSKSQPDLSQPLASPSSLYESDHFSTTSARPEPQQPHPRKSKKQSGGASRSVNSPTKEKESKHSQSHGTENEVLPSVQILEILMRENSNLKAELVNARRKISTIHKLEAELCRLQASHSALFESTERRESLERTVRVKLNSELKRLTAVNRELLSSSTSLQNLSPNLLGSDVEIIKRELSNKDVALSQLLAQNKELLATKERQDAELAAQRATLVEQRTHIEILDEALNSAQGNALRLEEECRKKQDYVDKVANLQRALSSLQISNDKREQSEKKLRSELETQITDLKLRLASINANQPGGGMCWNNMGGQSQGRSCQSPPPYPGAAGMSDGHSHNSHRNHDGNSNDGQLQLLQDKLKASEEQILNLNTQVSKWEQVLAPENSSGLGFRKHSSTSTPNTPNSWTNSNSRGGTPHFFSGHHSDKASSDELLSLSQTQSRANDLEWKIKDLESRLVEKDALIRVLQSVPNSPSGSSPLLFSASSLPMMSGGSGGVPPLYRDTPGYSMASTALASPGCFTPNSSTGSGVNVSSSMLGQHYANVYNSSLANQASQQLYAKLGQKCENEPPNYAKLPLKLRLGGSGSSLVKNSNESLQSGMGGGGVSPNISGPGSVSSTSGSGGAGSGGKSIDDQLKELDNQLLSKGGPGSLKMHSGLCCIPGFSHPSPATRKGKISQSLLESLNGGGNSSGNNNGNAPYSASNASIMVRGPVAARQSTNLLPPLPKPPSTYQTQNHGSQGQNRTSSGPPFISPASAAALSAMNSALNTTTSLSNSVDSVLSDQSPGKSPGVPPGGNVFTPNPEMQKSMPKGLPPKSPPGVMDSSAGKSRSLERNKANEPCAGKYTVMMYDQTRCRSLDRREAKKEKVEQKLLQSGDKKPEKEKTMKSSVSSKAAFFGQLLSRRSPSPAREKDDKDKKDTEHKHQQPRNPETPMRLPLGAKIPPTTAEKSGEFETDLDALLLDKQGRSSQFQRNRISSKWSSSNTLESVQEQSGSESPWSQRKHSEGGEGRVSPPGETTPQPQQTRGKSEGEDSSKKWGRIIKTPFGLRYTFTSPRVATSLDNFRK